jgi:membrane protein YqaA with SNARE-associated domain
LDYYVSPQSGIRLETDIAVLKNKYTAKKLLLIVFSVLIIAGTIVTAVLMLRQGNYVHDLQSYGYLGLFFACAIAGSPILVPTFSALLVITLGSISNPVVVGLIAGLGFAGGRMLFYLSARGSFEILEFRKIAHQKFRISAKITSGILRKLRAEAILNYLDRHSAAAIFLISLFPNPFLVPALLISGARQTSFWRVFLACWAGKTILFLTLAFLGYFGLALLAKNQ